MSVINKEEVQKRLFLLGQRIMEDIRASIFVEYKYMSMAAASLEPVNDDMVFTMAADGKRLYYNNKHVIKTYEEEKNLLMRRFLHSVFHCLFLHAFVSENIDKKRWDFACDVVVENVLSSMGGSVSKCRTVHFQENFINRVKSEVDSLTAEKIYQYVVNSGMTDEEVEMERKNFKGDSHQLWYSHREKKTDDENENMPDMPPEDDEGAKNLAEIISQWKDYCEQMNIDMESFSAEREGSSVIVQNTKRVRKDKHDYVAFLKKFAVIGEDIRVNDDEFDYIYYTYGLEVYKNMPLVEPLEYKEIKKISDFVIAIDTSGSVQGELVQKFLDKTYSILMDSENFFNKINIRIFQCDDKIEDEYIVKSKDDFEKYISTVKFKGFGGTDFTPVFERVNSLLEQKEFNNLKGIIYFTDGYGKYPVKKPPYDAAFIFMDYDSERPKLPPWAMGVVIDEKSLN